MEEIRFRVDELTEGELELIEEHAGIDALNAALAGRVSIKAVAVLIWIAWRKRDPNVTLEQIRGMKLSELPRLVVEGDADANPIDAAG